MRSNGMNGFLDDLPDIGFKVKKKPPEHPSFTPIDKCPNCGKENPWKVNKTENFPTFIRRLRECQFCGWQVKTREKVEDIG